MAATAAMIARVRRLADEATADTYTDSEIATYIEQYPRNDSDGNEPTDTDWTATYAVKLAAADLWEEKAAALAGQYDFAADGGQYTRSQAYKHAMQMAARYRGSGGRITSSTLTASPQPIEADDLAWRGNQPESYYE